jgi:CHAT domain-containing protein
VFFNSLIESSLFDAKKNPNDLAFDVLLFQKNLLLESERGTYSLILTDSLLKKQFERLFSAKKIILNMSFNVHKDNDYYNSLLDTVSTLESKLMRGFPENKLTTNNAIFKFNNVRNSLNRDECALEFISSFRESNKYYSAAITLNGNTHPLSVTLTSQEKLDSINKLIDENYSSDNLSDRTFELNKHLYHMFWEPLEPYLKGVKTIYYSPIDELNNVSFSTFVTNSNDTTYLMDKYNLQSLMSTAAIITNKNPIINNSGPSIALFGGIEYNFEYKTNADWLLADNRKLNKSIRSSYNNDSNRNEVSSIPFTKTEVDDIAILLTKNKWIVTKEFGKDATENKIKKLDGKKSPTILHFATHGFAFPKADNNYESAINIFESSDNPMQRSGLLFYAANDTWNGKRDTVIKYTGEDGILTAEEVSNLDLTNTKLVVISACQSGLGAIKGTEGVYGLKRAFKLAGVENMIVSLWPVPDKETMELMNLFYEELVKSKDINESFQRAQKTMRYKYPNNPWAWGGFVLVR